MTYISYGWSVLSKSIRIAGLIFSVQLCAQTFDFENGLGGWTKSGTAFDGQPVGSRQILSDHVAIMNLGGDYWRGLSFPVGQQGSFFIATGNNSGDRPTGVLTSPIFNLDPVASYLSFLIGGTNDIAHERLELQVRASPSEIDQLEHQIGSWAAITVPAPLPVGAPRREGEYLIVVSSTGTSEQLQQNIFEIPAFLFLHEARIKLIDDSITGHLNADFIQFTKSRPATWRTPVWGYADYHTHPTDYLAFGGLKGVHTLWGKPGGNYDDYLGQRSLINGDLPRCTTGHDGGPFANPFLNAAQKLQYSESLSLLFPHGKRGAPDFEDWPSFTAGAHQQMHITQIHRNYEGGLRLMVALATDNWGAEYLASNVNHGHVVLVDERVSVEKQIEAIKQLADKNCSWMEIAYSPDQARRIILRNKLALILGVEVDQLGTYHFESIRKEVDYLWGIGVRVVTPIHAADNRIGGAAVFISPYNWLNDLLNRGRFDLKEKDLAAFPAAFFQINEDKCLVSLPDKIGRCVELRLDWTGQNRLYLGRCLASLGRSSPCLEPTTYPEYNTQYGQKNKIGLKIPFGADYLIALMDHGMILDTAHMSDESVQDTFNLIGRRLERDHPECQGFTFETDMSDYCNALAYPAIVSHAHFRAQALYGNDEFRPSEYDISNRNIEMVRRVGGVIGPFVAEDRIAEGGDDNPQFTHNCAMSSQGYGYSFHFALKQMQGSGVGMATDFTFIPSVSPRFGKDACWAYHLARNPKLEHDTHQKDRYAIEDQREGVFYGNSQAKKNVSTGLNVPLQPYRLGEGRTYDYNVDGLAHIGLIPDMLQDLKNLGLSKSDFEALFSSAESYLQMWEKTERVSGYCDPNQQPAPCAYPHLSRSESSRQSPMSY